LGYKYSTPLGSKGFLGIFGLQIFDPAGVERLSGYFWATNIRPRWGRKAFWVFLGYKYSTPLGSKGFLGIFGLQIFEPAGVGGLSGYFWATNI
jgi:hypothetical protein